MEVFSDENRLSIGGRQKSPHRRSSILKGGKSPTRGALEDRDPNVQEENDTGAINTRSKRSRQSSSRRVSFASKDEVKEFRVEEWDSIFNKDSDKVKTCTVMHESQDESEYRQPASTIKGLDSLLTGNIQMSSDINLSEAAGTSFWDKRQSIDIGLDLTSCNGAGLLPKSEDPAHYTDNTGIVDQTVCYGQGILNQEMEDVSRSSLSNCTGIFGNNTVALDVTKCNGRVIEQQHYKNLSCPDVLAGGCDLDLTCHGPSKISLDGNENTIMDRTTNTFVLLNTGERTPLGDIRHAEKNMHQSPAVEEEKADVTAFLARLHNKQKLVGRQEDQSHICTKTNLQHDNNSKAEEDGSVCVKAFLSRLSSKPTLEKQKQDSSKDDNELELTLCHGTGINRDTINEDKQGRRSIYKTEDVDITVCHDRKLTQDLNTTSVPSVVPFITDKEQNSNDELDDDVTATMDLTGCVGSLQENLHLGLPLTYEKKEFIKDVTARKGSSSTSSQGHLHQSLYEISTDKPERTYTGRKSFGMDMTTCFGSLNESTFPKEELPDTFEMDMTTCIGGLNEDNMKERKPSARESFAINAPKGVGNCEATGVLRENLFETLTMDNTNKVGDQGNVYERKVSTSEFPAMDMTCCMGNLQQPSSASNKRTKRESLAMDLTMSIGNFQECNASKGHSSASMTSGMKIATCGENQNSTDSPGGQSLATGSLAMDITASTINLEQNNLQRQELSNRNSLGMDMTCIGSLPQPVISSSTSVNMSHAQNNSDDHKVVESQLTIGRQLPSDAFVCPQQPLDVKGISSKVVQKPIFEGPEVIKRVQNVASQYENATNITSEVKLTSTEYDATKSEISFDCPSQNQDTRVLKEDQSLLSTSEVQGHRPIPSKDPRILLRTKILGSIDDTTLDHMESDINKSVSTFKSKPKESIASGKLLLPEFPALPQQNSQPVSKLCSQFGRKRTGDHSFSKDTSLLGTNKSSELGSDMPTADGGNDKSEENAIVLPRLPKIAKLNRQKKEDVSKENLQVIPDQMSPHKSPVSDGETSIVPAKSPIKMDFTKELSTFQADSCSDKSKLLDDLNPQQSNKVAASPSKEERSKGCKAASPSKEEQSKGCKAASPSKEERSKGCKEGDGRNLSVINEESVCDCTNAGHTTLSLGGEIVPDSTTQQKQSVGPIMTVEKFLEATGISFDHHRVRRSMIPPVQNLQVQAIEAKDFILQLCYIKPKADLYGEMIGDMEVEIAKLKEKVATQEQELSANNPTIFQRLRDFSPVELAELQQQLRKVQHSCKKQAIMKYTERKINLKQNLKSVMKEKMEQLKVDIDAVEEYTSMADSCIHMLDDIDKEVTKNVDSLRKTVASREKKLERVTKHQLVSQQHLEEMKVKQEELTALEETRSTFIREKKELIAHKESLERDEIETHEKIRCLKKENDLKTEVEEWTRRFNTLESLHEWTLEELDWSQGATFSFLDNKLFLLLIFGESPDDAMKTDTRVVPVTDVRLDSRLKEDDDLSEKLAHNMVKQAADEMILSQMCSTTANLPQLLEQLSNVVYTARLVREETWRVLLSHLGSVTNTTLSVEFSSLKAFTKFIVDFQLDSRVYPKKLDFRVTPKIGRVTSEDVAKVFQGVAVGKNYLRRLVREADLFLEQCKSCYDF